MKTISTIYFIMLFLLVSCKNQNETELLKKQTLEQHDLVMAKHSTIIGYQLKVDSLINQLDSLKRAKPSMDTFMLKKNLFQLKRSLETAEDGMNDWMHQFNVDYTSNQPWEITHYFKLQNDKIKVIAKSYDTEIKRADYFFKTLKP